MTEKLIKKTEPAIKYRYEYHDYYECRYWYYEYYEITAENGKVFYRRNKLVSVKLDSRYDGFKIIEYRKTSQSFALDLNSKKWESGKIEFLKRLE